MVNKPLLNPYKTEGCTLPGGDRLTSHMRCFLLIFPWRRWTFTGDAFATFSHDPCESRCDTCLGIAGASQEPERFGSGVHLWKLKQSILGFVYPPVN